MNNRKERIEYFKKIESNYPFAVCEEVFLSSVIKNDFAMKYVKKQHDLIKDEVLHEDDFLIKYKYHVNTLVIKSLGNISSLHTLLEYMEYIEKNDRTDLLEALIKKSFSKLYKDLKNGVYYIKTSNIDECNVAFFILSFLNIDTSSLDEELLEILIEAGQIVFTEMRIPGFKNSSIMSEPLFKGIIKKYNLNKSTSMNKIDRAALHEFHNDFISFLNKKGFTIEECKPIVLGSFDQNSKLRDEFFATGKQSVRNYNKDRIITKMIEEYTFIYSQVREIRLEREDIISILEYLNILLNRRTIHEEEIEEYFLMIAWTYSLTKKINEHMSEMVGLFVENSNQQSLFDKEKSELQEEIFLLKTEQEEKTIALKNKDLEIERLNKELERAKAQVNNLNKKLSKVDDNKEELENLRELFFSLENKDKDIYLEKENSFEVDKSIKVAFIGGSDNLRNKMKEEFADFTYISPDDLTKDLSFIRNMDYVFIHTHMSHSMYFKIIDIIRFNKINFSFLNDVNIGLLRNNIFNKLENVSN